MHRVATKSVCQERGVGKGEDAAPIEVSGGQNRTEQDWSLSADEHRKQRQIHTCQTCVEGGMKFSGRDIKQRVEGLCPVVQRGDVINPR